MAQAEFFVHCPFGWSSDETTVIDRNEASIVMQVTFREGGRDSYLIARLRHRSRNHLRDCPGHQEARK